jgi:hypothetical protein
MQPGPIQTTTIHSWQEPPEMITSVPYSTVRICNAWSIFVTVIDYCYLVTISRKFFFTLNDTNYDDIVDGRRYRDYTVFDSTRMGFLIFREFAVFKGGQAG